MGRVVVVDLVVDEGWGRWWLTRGQERPPTSQDDSLVVEIIPKVMDVVSNQIKNKKYKTYRWSKRRRRVSWAFSLS